MRAFIAAELPEKTKNQLLKIQAELQRAGIQATWVKSSHFHLTLVFFGQISPVQLQKVKKIIKKQLEFRALKFKLKQLGAFPDLKFPKIIWIGLTGEIERLKLMTDKIRNGLQQEKIPFDQKPYSPHLTLGRLRLIPHHKRKQLGQFLFNFKIKEESGFKIRQISLIKSQLAAEGPIYQPVAKINLRIK